MLLSADGPRGRSEASELRVDRSALSDGVRRRRNVPIMRTLFFGEYISQVLGSFFVCLMKVPRFRFGGRLDGEGELLFMCRVFCLVSRVLCFGLLTRCVFERILLMAFSVGVSRSLNNDPKPRLLLHLPLLLSLCTSCSQAMARLCQVPGIHLSQGGSHGQVLWRFPIKRLGE